MQVKSQVMGKINAQHLRFSALAQSFDYANLGEGTRFDGIVLLAGKRTPFGDFNGALKAYNETDLAKIAAKGVIEATKVDPGDIKGSIWGNVIPSSKQAASLAKDVANEVGLNISTTGMTVNMLCGSGIKALDMAAKQLSLYREPDKNRIILAGGSESMTNAPFASFGFMRWFLKRAEAAKKVSTNWFLGGPLRALWMMEKTKLQAMRALYKDVGSMVQLKGPVSPLEFTNTLREGLTHWDSMHTMFDTAERLAHLNQIPPDALDAYSVQSQHRLADALDKGHLKAEIIPVFDKEGKLVLAEDELQSNPKARGRNVNVKSLQKLREKQGNRSKVHLYPDLAIHTAGNASRIVDGAVATLVTNKETADRLEQQQGVKPLGYILATGEAGVPPETMGEGAAKAAIVALKALNEKFTHPEGAGIPTRKITFKDIDVIEVNEAFAAVPLAAIKEWAQHPEFGGMAEWELRQKTNVNGGAIGLGHPLGATGARLAITGLQELKRRKQALGLFTACTAAGQGVAVIVQNPDIA